MGQTPPDDPSPEGAAHICGGHAKISRPGALPRATVARPVGAYIRG